ncbi:MAG TPA: antibiotic biosynthesis monooxygenase [Candidatus Thermoplasmatota archaeon]|nr:antibiotic biosynthesis monooxygenase [Candidatus Thermoplasmatota archaeon]
MITKLARYEVRREGVEKAVSATKTFADEVRRKEGGTARYDVFHEAGDGTRFLHIMTFRVASAEQYHEKTAWHKAFSEAMKPLLAKPVETVVAEPLV